MVATGISRVTSSFSDGWRDAVVEVGAQSASFEVNNPAMGLYQGSVRTFLGELVPLDAELVPLDAGYAQSNLFATTNLTWIGSTNPLAFSMQLDGIKWVRSQESINEFAAKVAVKMIRLITKLGALPGRRREG